MSVEAISHIMRTHIPDGVAKLVAMVLADYADPVSGRCWPKIPTLAAQCSQSERTVQRKLKVLEELEVLHVEPNTSGDRKGNVYILHLPGVARRGPGSGDPRPRQGHLATGDRSGRDGPEGSGTGDTQSPVSGRDQAACVTPTGDSADTRRVTLQSPPKESPRESTRRESPRRETRDSALPPASADAATAPRGAPSPRAVLCPDGFEPGDRHYAAAEAAGFDAAFVRQTAASMHRWSHANAHRPIARKADWALAFDGILDTALREAAERAAREARRSPASAPPRRSTNGGLALVAEMIGLPHDPADLLNVLGLEPGRDAAARHAGDGHVHRAVHEPAGGCAGLLPPQAAARRFGA
ncbi:MAG: helix-turn-helix domain-containing protein [Actinomycetospora chiangmaiensis]|nr:helix-turn-helix domain-containing protein [Actinomycetospora chiangmaiensis]